MAITSIVYDVDGVLVRSFEFAKVLADDYGIDRETQLSFFQGPMRECVVGSADMKEAIAPFLASWGWPSSVEDFVDQWFRVDGELNATVVDTVAPLRAAGYKCYVASTQESHRASWLEEHLGFGALFDDLFFSCRLGTTKGNVTFFERAADRAGATGDEMLFFDDAEVIVETARKAGWNAEVYSFGDDLRSRLREYDVLIPDA